MPPLLSPFWGLETGPVNPCASVSRPEMGSETHFPKTAPCVVLGELAEWTRQLGQVPQTYGSRERAG